MGLTDRFNPFSVGQTGQTQHNNTTYTVIWGKDNLSTRALKGQSDTNNFNLFYNYIHLTLQEITCFTERALDPLLTRARGPHQGLEFWGLFIFSALPSAEYAEKIISSEHRESMSGIMKTANVLSEDFNSTMFKLN